MRTVDIPANENLLYSTCNNRIGKNVNMLGQKLAVHAFENYEELRNTWLSELIMVREKLKSYFESNNNEFYDCDCKFYSI